MWKNTNGKGLFMKFCNSIQAAYVSFSTMSYLQEQNREKWSDFEEELTTSGRAQDSIKTFNLYFSKDILQNKNNHFIKDCFISPMDVTDELSGDNISLAGLYFLYCFSQLEYMGYELLKIKVPNTDKKEYNWHKCVNDDEIMFEFKQFRTLWKLEEKDMNKEVLCLFNSIKKKRNSFAHKSHYEDRKLKSDITSILKIGYYLYYLVSGDNSDFKIENYEENLELE